MNEYGFDDELWETAKEEAKRVLSEIAKNAKVITYTKFVEEIQTISMEPDDYSLRGFLGEISREEDSADRGMLSVLVVHKGGDNRPGTGFFELALELGYDVKDSENFWINELNRVHAVWK